MVEGNHADTIIGECDNCHFEDVEIKNFKGNAKGDNYNLCKVCSGTFLSHAVYYPTQCSDAALFRSLAYCTNMILKAIEKKNV